MAVLEGNSAVWRAGGGQTWERIVLPRTSSTIAINDDGTVAFTAKTSTYVATFFRYSASSWQQSQVMYFRNYSSGYVTPAVAYGGSTWVVGTIGGSYGGVFVSSDGGQSFSRLSYFAPAGLFVIGTKIHATNSGGYARVDIVAGLETTLGSATAPASGPISAGATTAELWTPGWHSTDGGDSWTRLPTSLTPSFTGFFVWESDGLLHYRSSSIEQGSVVLRDQVLNPVTNSWAAPASLVTTLASASLVRYSGQLVDGQSVASGWWLATPTALYRETGSPVTEPIAYQTFEVGTVVSGLPVNGAVTASPSGQWLIAQNSVTTTVLRSHDGATWETIVLPENPWSLSVRDDGDLLMLLHDNGGTYSRTYKDGHWFKKVTVRIDKLADYPPRGLVTDGSMWITTLLGDGIRYSADDGATWQSAVGGSGEALKIAGGKVYAWYKGNSSTVNQFTRWDIASRSFDIGLTTFPGVARESFVDASDPAVSYMASADTVFNLFRWNPGPELVLQDQELLPRGMTSRVMQPTADDKIRFYSVASCPTSNLVYGAVYDIATGTMSTDPTPLYLDETKTAGVYAAAPSPPPYPAGWNVDVWVVDSGTATWSMVEVTGELTSPEAVFGHDGYSYSVQGVNASIGAYSESWTDVSVAGVGPALELTRTYNSSDRRVGLFGKGWTSTYETRVFENCVNGDVTVLFGDGRRETHYSNGAGGYITPPGYTTHLTKTGTTGWTLSDTDGSVMTFRADGRLTAIADADAQALSLTYDASSRLTQVSDVVSGRYLNFGYTGSRVTSVSTNPVTSDGVTAPLEWRYQYSGSNLALACDARNNDPATGWCTWYYVQGGVIRRVTDANGHVDKEIGYLGGKVAWTEDGAGNRTTFDYVNSNKTVVTDPNGHSTTSEFDGYYRLVKTTDALGDVTTYHYDSSGMRDSVTDPLGRTTSFTFDGAGNQLSATDALGHTTWFGYDGFNNQTSVRDARSSGSADDTYAVTSSWDGIYRNKLTEATPPTSQHPAGSTRTWTYTTGSESAIGGGVTPARLLKAEVDPNGGVTAYGYDAKGNLRETTDSSGLVTEYGYDELGRLVSRTQYPSGFPGGVVIAYVLDAGGRVVRQDDAAQVGAITGIVHQRQVASVFDAVGNLVSVTEADIGGSAAPDPQRVSLLAYDAADRLVSVTDPLGGVSTTGYDAADNVTSRADARGQVVQYEYDALNRLTRRVAVGAVRDEGASADRDVVLETNVYDAAGQKVLSTDPVGVTTRFDYDAAGQLVKRVLLAYRDPDGSERDIVLEETVYDAAGHATSVATGGGTRVEQRTYDPAGFLVQTVQDPAGIHRVTDLFHDNAGNLVRQVASDSTGSVERRFVLDAGGRVLIDTTENGAVDLTTTYTYDNRGNRLSEVTPNGNVQGGTPADHTTNYTLDALGRTVEVTSPPVAITEPGNTTVARPSVASEYNTFGEIVAQRNERGHVVNRVFDALGRLTQTVYPDILDSTGTTIHSAESTTYDANGNVTSRTDGRGHTTDFTYDGLGRLIRSTAPAAGSAPRGVTSYWYDDAGQVATQVDASGARVVQSYDDRGRLRAHTAVVRNDTTTPDEYTTAYTYDDAGDLVSERSPLAEVTTFQYDQLGRRVAVVDPTLAVTTYAYDVADRVVLTTDPLGRATQETFDQAGRSTATTQLAPGGAPLAISTRTYDATGLLLASTSPRGNAYGADSALFTTSYQYDALGRLTAVVQPTTAVESIVTEYGYDAAGNLARVTDGRGNETWYGYNAWNLATSTTEPATATHPTLAERTWLTDYDAGGHSVKDIAPGNVITTRTLDELGRVTVEAGSGIGLDAATRTFGYDAVGRITSFGTPAGDVTLTWDDSGLLLATAGPTQYQSQFEYDADGRMTSRTDAAGTTTFSWNSRGNLVAASDGLSGTTQTLTYDAAGQVLTIGYDGQSRRHLAYDALGRLTSDQLRDALDAPVASYAYGYDEDGNVVSQTATLPGNSGAGANSYTYDAAGRLTGWTKPNSVTATFGWDPAGNLVNRDGVTSTYDARNQLLTVGPTSYSWSARGTLDSVTTDGVTVTSSFDALGRRVSSGKAVYQYDSLDRLVESGPDVLAYAGFEIDPVHVSGVRIARSPAGLPLVEQPENGVAVFAGRDRHEDIGYRFESDGALVSSTVFDPFGAVVASAGTDSPIGFQGDVTDPTSGDVWMGARWYDPATGGFSSRDTVFGTIDNPISLNRYTYAQNDPLGMWDPDGRSPDFTGDDCSMYGTKLAYDCERAQKGPCDGFHAMNGDELLEYEDANCSKLRFETLDEGMEMGLRLALGGVPVIGAVIDAYDCSQGDAVSCGFAALSAGGAVWAKGLKHLDDLGDFNRARHLVNEADGVVDLVRDVERSSDEMVEIVRLAREAGEVADIGHDLERGSDAVHDIKVLGALEPGPRPLAAIGPTGNPGAYRLGGATEAGMPATVRHYTTAEFGESISKGGEITPGVSSGKTWLTPDEYLDGVSAQSKLALNKTPDGYFEIPMCRVQCPSSPSVVQPYNGQPGGGIEITTTSPIDITGLPFIRFGPR
ncbi:MAG: RHS repeat-associated core domain-containing protein [Actinomycetota bacterium]|nr:RHS repeat-associated core domain-containing protein [Actinomycetota bacterium]